MKSVGAPDYVVLVVAGREEADKGCAFYVVVFARLEGHRFSFSGAINAKPDGAKFSPINCL